MEVKGDLVCLNINESVEKAYRVHGQSSNIKINDVRVLKGTGSHSDHYLLRSEIFLPYRHKTHSAKEREKHNTEKIKKVKYNLESLIHDSVKYLYQKRLNEKLMEELEEFEDIYKNILESIHRATEEALGSQEKRKSSKMWWTDEIDQLVKEKRTLYLKGLNSKSEEDKQFYIGKKNEVRRTVNAEKNKLWDKKCTEINTYIGGRRSTEV
ncbi:uncharacterized protein [Linepithema humile]|uniref:uncharacterized protein n=1 Tax=Linepithema humile TaxID=83485 RepID=UPI00351F412D